MSPYLSQNNLLYAGLAILATFILYLGLSQKQKEAVFSRLRLRSRRSSSSETPPRSLSPEKAPNNATPKSNEHVNTFPPSRREALEDYDPLSDEEVSRNIVGFTEDFRTCDPSKYVASGFSVKEIKALGDFPDYSHLCGVPPPKPYKEFDITKALPRPYRPFRWAYHQTMSLARLEPDWWLELENTYKSRIAQRKSLYEEHGDAVLQWLPGSELASKELMEMSLQFLTARYPQYFSLGADKKTFENKILGAKQDVSKKHPMLVLLDNVPEDFAIMLRDPETGFYQFRSGVICSALGWNVGTKIDKKLHEIHAPIPDYQEKMRFSMDRYFSKMPADKPIQRGSWGLEVDEPLYMPPGDPHEKYRELQSPDLTVDRCHLRVDWQTLRRLPLSGAIVFNFKAVFTSVPEFRDEPYIPSIILKVLNEGKQSIMQYKNTWHVEHVVKPALEQYEREQIEDGVIPKDWNVQTLDDSPWFPGWEKKWHKKQGF